MDASYIFSPNNFCKKDIAIRVAVDWFGFFKPFLGGYRYSNKILIKFFSGSIEF